MFPTKVSIKNKSVPLADRLRPKTINDFIGQPHLIGPGKPITLLIQHRQPQSLIFWGPPGSGKTTLARLIAQELALPFFSLSAVSAGKADVRKIVQQTQNLDQSVILFLDEIHRFNKAQQDFLLPYVESGSLILIGATTENPSFSVIGALLSRCRVYVLKPHSHQDLLKILRRAYPHDLSQEAIEFLLNFANGDARQLLNLVDQTLETHSKINLDNLKATLQSAYLRYDKKGDEHYNTISAYIKSLRASQVDAALYYLARMVEAGEDPRYIARRMVIFASEDIGIAQPTALVVANAVYRATETIGYPECSINLAHGTVYLALAKKSRQAYEAFLKAQNDVKQHGNLPVPLKIRNAPTKLMKDLGYHQGYQKYDQDSYLPTKIKHHRYFHATIKSPI